MFLGWALGSNDAANVFGTAVASRMVKFWLAALLCAVFVMLGAMLEGAGGMTTYQKLSPLGLNGAFIACFSAALTVALMSHWKLPVSTSQAVVGALVLCGLLRDKLDLAALVKIVLCWIGTPFGGMLTAVVLYFTLGKLMNLLAPSLFMYDRSMRWLLIIAGSYGAYALGANNVANVTGPFSGPGMLAPWLACLIGGGAIALGIFTYGKPVMMTVGNDLVHMNAFMAFIAVLAEAVTVHVYAMRGVPVSTSQAVVGAVLGLGLVKGGRAINRKTLLKIIFGWLGTPTISAAVAYVIFHVFFLLKLV